MYFIEIAVFCKCKQTSSKHVQIKKNLRTRHIAIAGGQCHLPQEAGLIWHTVCTRPGGCGPTMTCFGNAAIWGTGRAHNTRGPQHGHLLPPKGHLERTLGQDGVPRPARDELYRPLKEQRPSTAAQPHLVTHLGCVLSNVRDSRGYPQKHGIRVRLT